MARVLQDRRSVSSLAYLPHPPFFLSSHVIGRPVGGFSFYIFSPPAPPLGPGGARYHFLFLSFYVWSLPPTGRAPRYPARARASMSERYPHPVGAPRASPSARTLPWRPKINSSCSLHFLPDVKQPFVRSCQARKTVRGVSRFLSLYEWHIDWRFMRSTPDNKYPRARMV